MVAVTAVVVFTYYHHHHYHHHLLLLPPRLLLTFSSSPGLPLISNGRGSFCPPLLGCWYSLLLLRGLGLWTCSS